jgi:OPA family glycerol-3-phosphate transporter-like MFS transporter
MIQLGQVAINNLAPVILAGFTIGVWVVAKNDWHWLFRIPPLFVATVAVLMSIFVKNTPEEAGYQGLIEENAGGDVSSRTSLRESFTTIFTHPLIWFYAVAYACTGAVRNSSDQLMVLYFHDQLKLNMADKPSAVLWTVNLMPLVAVLGSFSAGVISDKFFCGHRSPVAMTLYFIESSVIMIAAFVIAAGVVGPTPLGILIGCIFLVLVALTANSTHAIVGAAAPMDIGGRKMAGFASGVVDSFQYYGTAIALPATGWMIDRHGWGVWYPIMSGFGVIGGLSMLMVMRKQRRLQAREDRAVASA